MTGSVQAFSLCIDLLKSSLVPDPSSIRDACAAPRHIDK
ncbi:hypothetical protein CUJ84_Chr004215 [Rhizobium leguminosarum]|uniref:Uncharacterized protein n=1 Tax=Rhizobium leguminosarum TaxID=384 RepID=A0A2K9Z8F7_RHILE|nr:hypothetical protein CUJ84_Chr004215 [Rhizobium leguminosarum]